MLFVFTKGVSGCYRRTLNDAQPATLMLHAGEDMEPLQRDALRARMVRERLA